MILSIVNHKGGTGKTTTTINLGSALASTGLNVLLIDFDAQANLTYSLGIRDDRPGIGEVLMGQADVKGVIKEREGLHVLPASTSLADVEISMAKADNRPTYLKAVLDELPNYDVVLIDCPPSISLLTVNALYASDFVIIPLQMEVLSVRGLDLILDTISAIQATVNPALQVLGVLPVMVDSRKNLNNEITEYIEANYQVRIFAQHIRTNVKASEAPSFGKSVVQYAPSSASAQDYKALTEEFLEIAKLSAKPVSL